MHSTDITDTVLPPSLSTQSTHSLPSSQSHRVTPGWQIHTQNAPSHWFRSYSPFKWVKMYEHTAVYFSWYNFIFVSWVLFFFLFPVFLWVKRLNCRKIHGTVQRTWHTNRNDVNSHLCLEKNTRSPFFISLFMNNLYFCMFFFLIFFRNTWFSGEKIIYSI